MDTSKKFILPSPCFKAIETPKTKLENSKSCLAVPQGDLLPMGPPMYGPRGSTIPPRFLGKCQQKYNQERYQQHPNGFKKFNNHEGKRFHNHNQNRQRKSVPVPNYQQDYTQQFWCETCDRPFNTSEQLESHKYEHQICGIDDCMFIGHPSVVAKHIEAQHTTGLYQKIKNLSTEEEIMKWREERKKRYPTKANIELRQKSQAERMTRGEKLSEKKSRFGQQSDRRQMGREMNENSSKRDDKEGYKVKKQQFNKSESIDKNPHIVNNSRRKRKRPVKENNDTEKIVENIQNKIGIFNGNLKMFTGTLSMPDYHPEQVKKLETNALSSLLDMYGSSSESESNDENGNSLHKEVEEENCGFFETALKTVDEKNVKKNDISLDENTIKINIEDNNTIKEKILDNISKTLENLPEKMIPTQNISEISENIDSDDIPDEEPIARKPEDELLEENSLTTNQKSVTSNVQPPSKRSRANHLEKSTHIRKKYNTLLDYSKLRKRRQNTMLEKLLETDIRHERNVLLQCVRYVVKNNFLGIGQKKS